MQCLELSKQIIEVLDGVPSHTALTTLDICRAVIKEKSGVDPKNETGE
jgi:hypothetical protein